MADTHKKRRGIPWTRQPEVYLAALLYDITRTEFHVKLRDMEKSDKDAAWTDFIRDVLSKNEVFADYTLTAKIISSVYNTHYKRYYSRYQCNELVQDTAVKQYYHEIFTKVPVYQAKKPRRSAQSVDSAWFTDNRIVVLPPHTTTSPQSHTSEEPKEQPHTQRTTRIPDPQESLPKVSKDKEPTRSSNPSKKRNRDTEKSEALRIAELTYKTEKYKFKSLIVSNKKNGK